MLCTLAKKLKIVDHPLVGFFFWNKLEINIRNIQSFGLADFALMMMFYPYNPVSKPFGEHTIIPEIFVGINFDASNFRHYYNRQKIIMLPLTV